MKTVLVLGATGRTGRLVLRHLPDNFTVYAGLRQSSYVEGRRSLPEGADASRIVDIDDQTSLSTALEGVDIVINAIRLREDIAASALVELHQSIVAARDTSREFSVVHVGGAGALYMDDGRRFWETPDFPTVTLPRGIGHANLRDYLEQHEQECRWTYLIPPPRYIPDGAYQERYSRIPTEECEQNFLTDGISCEDFAVALVDAVREDWHGVWLIGG